MPDSMPTAALMAVDALSGPASYPRPISITELGPYKDKMIELYQTYNVKEIQQIMSRDERVYLRSHFLFMHF